MQATGWKQVNITYIGTDPNERERHAADHLRGILPAAEARGDVSTWWFIRKGAWRIRYLPAHHSANGDQTHAALTTGPSAAGTWVNDIYEPEVHAFGGPASMDVAHTLFHHDCRHLLPYLAEDPADRRERSIILPTALMRSARLDLNEQGDVWARIAEQRTKAPRQRPVPTQPSTPFIAGVRHLILGTTKPDAIEQPWLDAFAVAGSSLFELRARGELTRGLRAVTALHVIFHWNRIGLDATTQATLALAAKRAVLD